MPYEQFKYFIVAVTDVEGLLTFSMQDEGDLKDSIDEYNRVQEELAQFISLLHSNLHEEIRYIGEEKIYDKHVERFLFDHGGFMEIILERPLVLKAQFLNKARAETFAQALRDSLNLCLANHPIKTMFISSIQVEEVTQNPLTVEKWMKMHHLYIRKTFVYTILALSIAAIFEIVKAALQFIYSSTTHSEDAALVNIVVAVIVAFMFEPVKKRTEAFVNRYFIK